MILELWLRFLATVGGEDVGASAVELASLGRTGEETPTGRGEDGEGFGGIGVEVDGEASMLGGDIEAGAPVSEAMEGKRGNGAGELGLDV